MQWARRPTSIAQYTCRQLGSVPIPKASPTSYQAKSNWSVVKAARQPLTLGTRNVKKHFRSSPSSDPLKSLDEDQQLPHTQHISPTYATADPQEMYSKLQRHAAQQQLPPGSAVPQQTPFSPHQSFKYAQLGHSRFSRGSPHVCYWHLDGKGMFYVKPEWYELVAGWQDWLHAQQQQQGHQHQPPGLGFQQAAGEYERLKAACCGQQLSFCAGMTTIDHMLLPVVHLSPRSWQCLHMSTMPCVWRRLHHSMLATVFGQFSCI